MSKTDCSSSPDTGRYLEILENVQPSPDLVAACNEMAQKSCAYALDDFIYSPERQPLNDLAQIIKFDFRLGSLENIQNYLKKIKRHDNLILLAEKMDYTDFYKLGPHP